MQIGIVLIIIQDLLDVNLYSLYIHNLGEV